MGGRGKTRFVRERQFDKAVNSLGPSNVGQILDDVVTFQNAWRKSETNADIPDRFHYEEYKGVKGPYRVSQIYVGPKRKFRAAVQFMDGNDEAHWVHAFKKEAGSEPGHVELAKRRAKGLWDKMRRRQP